MLITFKKSVRKPRRLLGLCAALVYWSFGSAYATQYPMQTIRIDNGNVLAEQVRNAQLIFEGTVTDIAVRVSYTTKPKQTEQQYSFFTFDVARIIKGKIMGNANRLTLHTKGTSDVIESDLKSSKKVDFFIRKNNQDTPIYSMTGSAEYFFDGPENKAFKDFQQAAKKYAINKNSKIIMRFDGGNELLLHSSNHMLETPPLKKGDHVILMVTIDPKTQQPILHAEQGIDVLNFPKTQGIWIDATGKILFDSENLASKDKKPYTPDAFAQVVSQKIERAMLNQPNHDGLIPIASEDPNQPIYEDSEDTVDTQRSRLLNFL